MDLYWKNLFNSKGTEEKEEDSTDTSSFTFHMNNEMYFSQTWNFTSSSSSSSPATTTTATLKTRAVMWGTEAHENWYLLDYHPEWQTMLIYYCAYTEAVDRFDSITMVLQKKQNDEKHKGDTTSSFSSPVVTKEQATYFEARARELLGDYHGRLQPISPCLNNLE